MNFRTTYYLMAAAGAVLAGFFVYVFFIASDAPSGEGYLLPSFHSASIKPADITTVEVERTTPTPETLVFVRDGKDRWKLVKPVETRVESHAIDGIVRDLLDAKREQKGIEVKDKKTHGLENPEVKITLKKGADKSATVSLGDVTTGADKAVVYVLSSDVKGDRPLVVKKSALNALFKFPAPENATDTASLVRGLNDFRSTKLLGDVPDPVSQTASVRIEQGKNIVAFSRRPDGTWQFDHPIGYGDVETEGSFSPGGTEKVNNLRSLLQNIYNVRVPSAKDFIDRPEDLAKYGLNNDNPDLMRIRIEHRPLSGQDATGSEELLIGKSTGVPGDKFYAKLANENTVAEVAGTEVRAIKGVLEEPKALRNKDVVHLSKDKINAIELEHPGGKVELRLVGEPPIWKVYDSAGNAQSASRSAVEEVLSALTAPKQVIDFPPRDAPDNALGFDNRAGEIRFWLGSALKDETKKDEPKKDEPKKEEAKKDEKKDSKEAKKEEPKKEEAKKDTGPAGAPKPAGEPSVRLVFGKESGEGVYVRRIEGTGHVDVLAPKALLKQVRKTRLDFLDVTLPPLAIDQVVKVQFNKGKDSFDIEKDTKDGSAGTATWKMQSPDAQKGRLADAGKINTLLTQLSMLRALRVTSEKASADELAKLGLDPKAPRLKISLMFKDAAAGEKERVYWFGNDAGMEKHDVYARVAGQDMVFEAPRTAVDSVEKNDFLDTVVYRVDRAKVKGLKLRGWADVVGSPIERELVLQGGRWTFKNPVGYEIDSSKVDTFLDDVLAPRAESFVVLKTGPVPAQGLDVGKGALEIEIDVDAGKPVTLMVGAADPTGKLVFAQTNQLPGDVFTLLKDRFKSVRDKPAVFKKD